MVENDFKNIRLVLGCSQEQMADNLGISPAYIKKLECGAMPVSSKVLERLNDFLTEKYPDGSLASTWFALMPWASASIIEGLTF